MQKSGGGPTLSAEPPWLSQREPELTGVGNEKGQGPGDRDLGFDFLPFMKGSQKKFSTRCD